MSLDGNNIWKLRFDILSFDMVLLNNTNDWDENIRHNLRQIDSVFYIASSKKLNHKTFSVLNLNVGSLNQNFESLKKLFTTIKFVLKVICRTETWWMDNPSNKTLFNLGNYTSLNQVRNHGRGGVSASLFTIL